MGDVAIQAAENEVYIHVPFCERVGYILSIRVFI
jgi:coproporphyrinogen III oxidase-like Fe-S oxidoreductase